MVGDPDFRQRMRQVMDIGRQVDARDGPQDAQVLNRVLGCARWTARCRETLGCSPRYALTSDESCLGSGK